MGLPDQSLSDFIDALAADRPAPGAGAAAALCLALAAGCAAKAFRISARHRDGDAGLTAAADRALALARAALDGAERDAVDFTALLHRGPDAEQALKTDGEAALSLADQIRDLVRAHAVIEMMAGDHMAALALCEAAERVERRNLSELK